MNPAKAASNFGAQWLDSSRRQVRHAPAVGHTIKEEVSCGTESGDNALGRSGTRLVVGVGASLLATAGLLLGGLKG